MSKKSPKYKIYDQGFSEEVIWNARVFLCLQGSCLKSHLQDMLKKMMPNVKGRLDARDADVLLARLHTNGLIKYVEYNSKNKNSSKIYAITDDAMQKSGDLIQLLEGIFRYWFMNIHPKRRKKGKLDREHNQFISTQDWEPKWGHDFIKKWANFVEDDMTDEMKDQFQVDVSGKMSLSQLYKTAKRKAGRID